jgi:hypothetical protein
MAAVNLIVITDTRELARAATDHLRGGLPNRPNVVYMTYGNSRLSAELIQSADLVVLGLFRCYGYRVRAEGVMTASKLVALGKPCLVISGLVRAGRVPCRCYWDLASEDELGDRVRELLREPPKWEEEMELLQQSFEQYCFKPSHHHGLPSG